MDAPTAPQAVSSAMATFDVVIDTRVLDRKLTQLELEQLPFARSLAANQAAFETMGVMRRAMPLFIDEPTSFTVSGVRYRKGTKESPAAEIYLSGDAAKGTAPSKYLTVTRGGQRGQRRSERVLQRAGLLSADEGWVPGKWLKKNRYGNQLTGARLTQILSSVKAFGEEGFSANVTARSKATKRGRSRTEYFVSRGTHMPRGIWERHGTRGRAKHKYKSLPAGRPRVQRGLRPVMLFVKLPRYSKTFDFVALASAEARRRFVRAWPGALARALRTARPR